MVSNRFCAYPYFGGYIPLSPSDSYPNLGEHLEDFASAKLQPLKMLNFVFGVFGVFGGISLNLGIEASIILLSQILDRDILHQQD